eukprot:1295338-Prymnesium_polylepis.1
MPPRSPARSTCAGAGPDAAHDSVRSSRQAFTPAEGSLPPRVHSCHGLGVGPATGWGCRRAFAPAM